MKLVFKFHHTSPSSLGGVRGKPPSGIKSYSFIDCREEKRREEIEIAFLSKYFLWDFFSVFDKGFGLYLFTGEV